MNVVKFKIFEKIILQCFLKCTDRTWPKKLGIKNVLNYASLFSIMGPIGNTF